MAPRDVRVGEGPHHDVANLLGRRVEGADVVGGAREALARRGRQRQQRLHAVGHRHERDAGVGPDEAGVRLALRRGVDHLGRVVGRAAGRHGDRGDQAREAHAPEVHAARELLGRELLVVPGVVVAELLAVELVAAVHRGGVRELVFLHLAGAPPRLQVRQAVGRDRARVDEHHRPAVRLALALRELQQVQGALDVHVVGGGGRELGPRGQQGREVEDEIHLELREDPLEQRGVEDRTGHLALHHPLHVRLERLHVQRHDLPRALGGEALDQAVTDLAAGPRDQNDGLSHACLHAPPLSARAPRTRTRVW